MLELYIKYVARLGRNMDKLRSSIINEMERGTIVKGRSIDYPGHELTSYVAPTCTQQYFQEVRAAYLTGQEGFLGPGKAYL